MQDVPPLSGLVSSAKREEARARRLEQLMKESAEEPTLRGVKVEGGPISSSGAAMTANGTERR